MRRTPVEPRYLNEQAAVAIPSPSDRIPVHRADSATQRKKSCGGANGSRDVKNHRAVIDNDDTSAHSSSSQAYSTPSTDIARSRPATNFPGALGWLPPNRLAARQSQSRVVVSASGPPKGTVTGRLL
jgi:hypothetical protein